MAELYNTSVAQLLVDVKEFPFLRLDKLTTIEETLNQLSKEKARLATVFDGSNFLGTVDVFDVIYYLLAYYHTEKEIVTPLGIVNVDSWCTDIKQLNRYSQVFSATTIEYVINLHQKMRKHKEPSTYSPSVLYVGDPLSLAIKAFVSQATYQLPVMKEGKFVTFVTQQDVNNYLYSRINRIGKDIADKPISELFCVPTDIISINQNKMAIEAFQLIASNKISAVAVVNDDNQLVANFSASDLVGIVGESIADMTLPILEFLRKHNMPGTSPISKTSDLSLENLMLTLYTEKIHRVWVTDAQNCPVGVVSLSDVLQLLDNLTDIKRK